MSQTIAIPDTTTIETRGRELVAKAKAIEIKSHEDYSGALEFGRTCAALLVEIKSTFEEPKRLAFAAHKAIAAAETKHARPIEEAKDLVSRKAGAWSIEQERIRQQKEAELQVQARKLEEDRRLAEASALEARGKKEEATRLLAQPIQTIAVQLEKEVPKVQGVSTRENWTAEITDFAALVKHVAQHDELLYLLEPNASALNKQASSLKSMFSLPGVKAVKNIVTSYRTAKQEEDF